MHGEPRIRGGSGQAHIAHGITPPSTCFVSSTGSIIRRVVCVAAMLGLSILAGCAAAGPSSRHFSVRPIKSLPIVDLLDSSERAMIDLGLVVERNDPIRREIVSAPFDVTTRLGPQSPVQLPGPNASIRRVAVVRVDREQETDVTRVFCRVEVQRQTTQSLRMLSMDQRPSDVPNATPIEREAATTSEQNTVWQTVRRDVAAERAILDAIKTP